MRTLRVTLLVAIFGGTAFAAGPLFRHKEPIISQEVENIYKDIGNAKALAVTVTPWVSYTPTWAATGTQPAINTGTLTGKWRRVGDTMEVQVAMIVDGASTYGTGGYTFSLPPTYTVDDNNLANGGDSSNSIFGTAHALDVGTAIYIANVFYNTSSTVRMLAIPGGTQWGQTSPMTWANGDKMFLKFSVPISGWGAK